MRLEYQTTKQTFPILWSDSLLWSNEIEGFKTRFPGCIFCAPDISEYSAREYRAASLNHADFNGRFFLQHDSILIDRSPILSEYRNPPQRASGFSSKATRVIRVLLNSSSASWTQRELAQATGCTAGYVSRILRTLVEQGLVEKKGHGGPGSPIDYLVPEMHTLLSDWQREDYLKKRVTAYRFACEESDHDQLVRMIHESLSDSQHAFTQWTAAWIRNPYRSPPCVSVYVQQETLHWFKPGRPVESGGNLQLFIPEDEGVFHCLQRCDGSPLVSDAQIYLDLVDRRMGDPDAAEAFRNWEGFGKQPSSPNAP